MSNCPLPVNFAAVLPFAPVSVIAVIAAASRLKNKFDACHDRFCDGNAV